MERKLRKFQRERSKKGAYDLGRKSVYWVVAILFIGLIFAYVSNELTSYKLKSAEYINHVLILSQVANLERCISVEENERVNLGFLREDLNLDVVKKCLNRISLMKGSNFLIKIDGKEVVKTSDEFEYVPFDRYFFQKNQIKKVTFGIESMNLQDVEVLKLIKQRKEK